ncbi:MAG: hypothetical protein HQ549_00425 [Candidatus Omnitrophica bacterium]|nr:hypothetical protein [Candidatus Omnitrophota bacterium]
MAEKADNMLKEIIEKSKTLDIFEKRTVNDEYCEYVVATDEINKWEKMLTGILGPATKPAKVKPTKEDVRITQECGGVFDNQTLFKKEFEDGTIIAMFWPWQDDTHTTVKIAFIKK